MDRLVAWSEIFCLGAAIIRIEPTASSENSAAVPKASCSEIAASTPPTTGPRILAICQAEALSEMALASASGGTKFGASDDDAGLVKARAVPISARMANTGQTSCGPMLA